MNKHIEDYYQEQLRRDASKGTLITLYEDRIMKGDPSFTISTTYEETAKKLKELGL